MARWLGCLALSIAGLLFAAGAMASPQFPDEVKAHLMLANPPPCSLCHTNGVTGVGTVNTPFGKAMRAHGLQAEDTASLDSALDQMKSQNVDSDGDGVSDIDELIKGADPNTAGTGSLGPEPPTYGCVATVAPGTPGRTGAFVAALGFFAAVALVRRRRRWSVLLAMGAAASALAGCYDVSYVSTDVCPSGLEWTGGDRGSSLMHPGRACMDCHGQGRGPQFQVAGTVFSTASPDDCLGAKDVTVVLTGSDGKTTQITVNEAGNFYTRLNVAMPYQAMVISGGKQNAMSASQSTGDCNGCHAQIGKNGAPGRILAP
jgi:MYXO-CTERM domain-containing protein